MISCSKGSSTQATGTVISGFFIHWPTYSGSHEGGWGLRGCRSRIPLSGWGQEWYFYTPASGISWSRNSFWLKECNSAVTSRFSCFCALLDTCSHHEKVQALEEKWRTDIFAAKPSQAAQLTTARFTAVRLPSSPVRPSSSPLRPPSSPVRPPSSPQVRLPSSPQLDHPAHKLDHPAHHRQARENRRLSGWIQPKLPTCRTINSIIKVWSH